MQRGRNFFDVQSPIFRPLWLRIALVLACLGWAAFELRNGAPVWALLFGAAGLYLGYQFLVVFDPDRKNGED